MHVHNSSERSLKLVAVKKMVAARERKKLRSARYVAVLEVSLGRGRCFPGITEFLGPRPFVLLDDGVRQQAAVETRQLQIADSYLLQLQGRYQPLLQTPAGISFWGGVAFRQST